MSTQPSYNPHDTRTLALHPGIVGQRVAATLPDGTYVTPGPDGLFETKLPVLTVLFVDGKGWRKVAPGGELGSPDGFLSPEEAATQFYPPAAQARAVSVERRGDDAIVVVDTTPSRPLRVVCVREHSLWVYDATRSEYVQ